VGLVLRFFEFLDIQCPNNNIHNIRVCRVLAASGAISTEHLHSMDVAKKVCLMSSSMSWI
jgi:serine/threonine-protein kinase ULK4